MQKVQSNNKYDIRKINKLKCLENWNLFVKYQETTSNALVDNQEHDTGKSFCFHVTFSVSIAKINSVSNKINT